MQTRTRLSLSLVILLAATGARADLRDMHMRNDSAIRAISTPAHLPDAERMSGPTIAGDVRVHRAVASQFLRPTRDVWIYLPPGYDDPANAQRHYPVLYMHDGNNVFDARVAFLGREWMADETAQRLIQEGKIEPLIIVGVSNTPDRMVEYSWVPGLFQGHVIGGDGPLYARFLVEELKPAIDQLYRTLPDRRHTAVMGSSMGGLITVYLGLHHSDTFGQLGIVSPAIFWNDHAVLDHARSMPHTLRIWLDMGKQEERPDMFPTAIDDARRLRQVLLGAGYAQGTDLGYCEDPDGDHTETSWARRLPAILEFFFGR